MRRRVRGRQGDFEHATRMNLPGRNRCAAMSGRCVTHALVRRFLRVAPGDQRFAGCLRYVGDQLCAGCLGQVRTQAHGAIRPLRCEYGKWIVQTTRKQLFKRLGACAGAARVRGGHRRALGLLRQEWSPPYAHLRWPGHTPFRAPQRWTATTGRGSCRCVVRFATAQAGATTPAWPAPHTTST